MSNRQIAQVKNLKAFPPDKHKGIIDTLNESSVIWTVIETFLEKKINRIQEKRRSEITAKEANDYLSYQAHLNGQEFALAEILKLITKG